MVFNFSRADFDQDVKPLIPDMRKAHVTFENPAGTVWFKSVSEFGEVAGVCAVSFTKNTARFKSVFVKPFFRGHGMIYTFFRMVDGEAKWRSIKRVTGFFNTDSVHAAVKYGYVVQSVNANEVSFAERYI